MAAAAPLPMVGAGWWELVNGSPAWQDGIFWSLSVLYGLVAASSFIQVIRIQYRVPEYGWTTQKVFQFLNFIVNGARCSFFAFRRQVQQVNPQIFQHVILDLPGLAFFTTYAMLALFWGEISHQARGLETDGLRSGFYTINGVIYALQVTLWLLLWWNQIIYASPFEVIHCWPVLLCCAGFSAIWWEAFPHAETFSHRVKREAKKAERGWQSWHSMFLLFLGTMHNDVF